MNKSRLHHCVGQEMVAQGIEEPPARKCRCRKYVSITAATKMVKNGEARWVVIKRSQEIVEEICKLCQADPEVKNCANCGGKGKRPAISVIEEYNNDIVLVSRASVDKKEKKYRPALAMKTPRVPTIESEHILRAYVLGIKESAERIEEYGRLVQDALMFVGKDRHPMIKPEPPDDPKTGTGRKYDWGRAI
jgi:hypothetical protein